jgi:sec-independent protein translocase protein TatA
MFYSKPWLDALIVLGVILLFFGPKRLPALGRSLGHGMREFKDAITGRSKPTDDERAELESQTGVTAATQSEQSAAAPATESTGASEGQSEPAAVSGTAGQASGSQPR